MAIYAALWSCTTLTLRTQPLYAGFGWTPRSYSAGIGDTDADLETWSSYYYDQLHQRSDAAAARLNGPVCIVRWNSEIWQFNRNRDISYVATDTSTEQGRMGRRRVQWFATHADDGTLTAFVGTGKLGTRTYRRRDFGESGLVSSESIYSTDNPLGPSAATPDEIRTVTTDRSGRPTKWTRAYRYKRDTFEDRFTYDKNGRLSLVVLSSGARLSYTHDAAGRLIARTAGEVKQTLKYDRVGRLVESYWTKGRAANKVIWDQWEYQNDIAIWRAGEPNSSNPARILFHLDPQGNWTKREEQSSQYSFGKEMFTTLRSETRTIEYCGPEVTQESETDIESLYALWDWRDTRDFVRSTSNDAFRPVRRRVLEKVLAERPHDLRVRALLSNCLISDGAFNEAVELWNTTDAPRNGEAALIAALHIGFALLSDRKFDSAMTMFRFVEQHGVGKEIVESTDLPMRFFQGTRYSQLAIGLQLRTCILAGDMATARRIVETHDGRQPDIRLMKGVLLVESAEATDEDAVQAIDLIEGSYYCDENVQALADYHRGQIYLRWSKNDARNARDWAERACGAFRSAIRNWPTFARALEAIDGNGCPEGR